MNAACWKSGWKGCRYVDGNEREEWQGKQGVLCQWADIQWDRIAEIKSYYQYPCSFLLAARKSRDLPMAKANALISDPIRALCGNAVILRRIAVAGKAVGRLDHL